MDLSGKIHSKPTSSNAFLIQGLWPITNGERFIPSDTTAQVRVHVRCWAKVFQRFVIIVERDKGAYVAFNKAPARLILSANQC